MHNAALSTLPNYRAPMPDKGIDWEPLPSMAHLIARVKPRSFDDQPVWAETMPADFDTLSPSNAFVEALPGVMLREVDEPDIFKLFFETAR